MRSYGNILCESNTSISGCSGCHNEDKELLNAAPLDVKSGSQFPVLESDSVHGNEISLTCESEVSNLRYTPMIPQTHHVPGGVETESSIHSGDSNFLDLEWLST